MSLKCLQGWQFRHTKPRLNNPTSLSCPSCILFSRSFTSFSALWARSSILLAVRGPKLSTVLELQSHQCRVQMHKHFPSPAGHAISDVGQDVTTLLGHLGTLMAPVDLAFNQHPQALFCWATLQALFPQAVPLHGLWPRCDTRHFTCSKFHKCKRLMLTTQPIWPPQIRSTLTVLTVTQN